MRQFCYCPSPRPCSILPTFTRGRPMTLLAGVLVAKSLQTVSVCARGVRAPSNTSVMGVSSGGSGPLLTNKIPSSMSPTAAVQGRDPDSSSLSPQLRALRKRAVGGRGGGTLRHSAEEPRCGWRQGPTIRELSWGPQGASQLQTPRRAAGSGSVSTHGTLASHGRRGDCFREGHRGSERVSQAHGQHVMELRPAPGLCSFLCTCGLSGLPGGRAPC